MCYISELRDYYYVLLFGRVDTYHVSVLYGRWLLVYVLHFQICVFAHFGGFLAGKIFAIARIFRNVSPCPGPVLFLPMLTLPGRISPLVLVYIYTYNFTMSGVSTMLLTPMFSIYLVTCTFCCSLLPWFHPMERMYQICFPPILGF